MKHLFRSVTIPLMKVMGASPDNGLLYVDVVREVLEAAKPATIKIGTTVETSVEERRAP